MNAAIFYSPNNLSVQEIPFTSDQNKALLEVNGCELYVDIT